MYTIEIVQDDNAFDPRKDFDHAGKMICFHSRYDLGDKHNLTVEQAEEIAESSDYISLPLFLYDHSGITISTQPFSCPWDSGQVGIIYFPVKEMSKEGFETKEQVINCLISEVKEYDDYLTGNVWGYVIEDQNGNLLDSCFGFYGDPEYCMSEAKDIIKHYQESDYEVMQESLTYAE